MNTDANASRRMLDESVGSSPLTLVPFAPQHFSMLSTWFTSEREIVQWGGPAVHFPLDAAQMHAMLAESQSKLLTRSCWMARSRVGELVGHAQVVIDSRNGNANIGRVAIAPAHRGQRLAGQLMSLIVARAFSCAEIERVELNVYAWNAPAIRTYERMGFRREGIRRSSTRMDDERWDTIMMSQLRSEYVSLI